MRARPLIFIFAACALVSMIAYGVRLVTGPNGTTAHASLVTRNASKNEEKLLSIAQPKPQKHCPKPPDAVVPAPPQTGHHKVFLTWNASTYFSDRKRHAAGYCLYRSGTQNVAASDPKCDRCEQVNQKPIPGTACVDDLVEDGAKYYYVATAVNEDGEPSPLSNETFAPIPSDPKATGSAAKGSYPRCRADNGSQ
jgi:hypothetical protein